VSIVVETIPSGPPFGSNCYLLRGGPDATEAVVVDPGGEARPLLARLEQERLRLVAILVTHADIDHVAAVAELAEATAAPVYVPAGEADELRSGSLRGGFAVAAHGSPHELADGDRLELGGLGFDVIAVPGHSRDHVAFASDGNVFSGDLVFAGSVGRSDLPGGDHTTLLASVARLLARCGPDTTVYPGHGEPTTLGRELASNPFLGPLRAH